MLTKKQIPLSAKQIHDLLEDQYIDQKIMQCEAFLDDIDQEEEADVWNQVNQELVDWKALKSTLESTEK